MNSNSVICPLCNERIHDRYIHLVTKHDWPQTEGTPDYRKCWFCGTDLNNETDGHLEACRGWEMALAVVSLTGKPITMQAVDAIRNSVRSHQVVGNPADDSLSGAQV